MSAYITYTEHVAGCSALVDGDAHAGQSFVGDLVRTCRTRSQWSHMRGLPGVLSLMTDQGHIVAARVYRACCRAVVGRGFARECCHDGIFKVRAR